VEGAVDARLDLEEVDGVAEVGGDGGRDGGAVSWKTARAVSNITGARTSSNPIANTTSMMRFRTRVVTERDCTLTRGWSNRNWVIHGTGGKERPAV
jgi:hypothetical protein